VKQNVIADNFTGRRRSSRGDAVYSALRKEIESGRFVAGTHLREEEIANLLGVSRTPVRDAVSRLVLEGILTVRPSRGVTVTELDQDRVVELYEALELLEGAVSEIAAIRGSRNKIPRLEQIIIHESDLLDNVGELTPLNEEFHQIIYDMADNHYLVSSLRNLSYSFNLLKGTTLADPVRAQQSHQEHVGIVSAIRQRDSEMAGRIAREHVRNARRVRIRMLFPPSSE